MQIRSFLPPLPPGTRCLEKSPPGPIFQRVTTVGVASATHGADYSEPSADLNAKNGGQCTPVSPTPPASHVCPRVLRPAFCRFMSDAQPYPEYLYDHHLRDQEIEARREPPDLGRPDAPHESRLRRSGNTCVPPKHQDRHVAIWIALIAPCRRVRVSS